MFWTLGGSQVGKAMLHGWREVLGPARCRGAHLWPFDDDLAGLAKRGGVVLAETYPGDSFAQLGIETGRFSKRDQEHRKRLADDVFDVADHLEVWVDQAMRYAIAAGFPSEAGTDDGFDAVLGLFAMIAVVSGRRPEGTPNDETVRRREGWILGRAPTAAA